MASTTGAKAADKADEQPEALTYTVERLQEEAEVLLGVPAHVVAGAVHLDGRNRKSYTVDEAKKLVDRFLKAPDSTGSEA